MSKDTNEYGHTERSFQRGIVVIAVLAVVVGIARILQDVTIAWRFGTGPAVDAFYFVSNLVNWPVMVVLSTFTVIISPAEAALRARSFHELMAFRSEILAITLLACGLLLPFIYFALDFIVKGSMAGLPTDTAEIAAQGVLAASLAVICGITAAVLTGWLISSNHRTATLLDAVPPTVLVAAAVISSVSSVLFWGLLAGFALQAFFQLRMLASVKELPIPHLSLQSTAWPSLATGGLIFFATQMIFAAIPVVDQFFAARLDQGTVAALNFANRLLVGLLALVALGIQRAGLPVISNLMVHSRLEGRRFAVRWARRMFVLGVLMAATLWVAVPIAVEWLYARGNFTPSDALFVVELLRIGAIQTPFFLAGTVIVVALASTNAVKAIATAAVIGLIAKFVLNAALVNLIGAAGIQWATAGMYGVTLLATWFALRVMNAHPIPTTS